MNLDGYWLRIEVYLVIGGGRLLSERFCVRTGIVDEMFQRPVSYLPLLHDVANGLGYS